MRVRTVVVLVLLAPVCAAVGAVWAMARVRDDEAWWDRWPS